MKVDLKLFPYRPMFVQELCEEVQHYCEKVEHHPPDVPIRGAINSKHQFGPYFFDGPVNHLNYLAMLENWFQPQLQSLGIESIVWFQQNGRQIILQ